MLDVGPFVLPTGNLRAQLVHSPSTLAFVLRAFLGGAAIGSELRLRASSGVGAFGRSAAGHNSARRNPARHGSLLVVFSVWTFMLLATTQWVEVAAAQSQGDDAGATTGADTSGADSTAEDSTQATRPGEALPTGGGVKIIRAGGRDGIASYPENVWAMTGLVAMNRSREEREIEITVFFQSSPDVRYRRSMWLPPRATRSMVVPMFVSPLPDGVESRRTVAIVKDLTTGELIRATDDAPEFTLPITAPIENYVSIVLGEGLTIERGPKPPAGADGIKAMRVALGKTVQLSTVLSNNLPSAHMAFDALDLVAISNEVIQRDGSAAEAIRHWNSLGGNVWLMLNRVSDEAAQTLFPGDTPFQVIDRLSVNQFTLTSKGKLGQVVTSRDFDFEEPVGFVRVLVDSDVDVVYWIDDWPAAFLVPRGEGKVLVTTIGLDAWTMPASHYPSDHIQRMTPDVRPFYTSDFYPQQQLSDLSRRLVDRPEEEPATEEDFREYLTERIGYEVASRGQVSFVLFCFVGTIGAVGLLLRRIQRMSWILVVAPLVTLTTLFVLYKSGSGNSQAIPRTVGVIQWLDFSPGSSEGVVEGQVAFYHPDRTEFRSGANGAVFELDMSGLSGTQRRVVWTDPDTYHWDELTIPSGLRFAQWRRPITLPEAPRAYATYGDALVGTVLGAPWKDLQDAVIVFPGRQTLAVTIDESHQLSVNNEAPLGNGQFVSGTLLTDEQRRRQSLIAKLISRSGKSEFPSRPTLFAWTEDEPEGLLIKGEARRFQSTLVSMPIHFERPKEGSFTVGSSFLPLRTVPSPIGGEGQASIYDAGSNQWVEKTSKSSAWLRFQIPRELLPLDVDNVSVVVDVDVPSREVEFRSFSNGEANTLEVVDSPAGTRTFRLSKEQFELDSEGGILFGIKVSSANVKGDQKPRWKITDVRMTADVRIPQ